MTKEEQIEEMAKDIAGIEQQEDLTLGEVYGIEATFELAEILCDAGYRKADEVRKETAREVIKPYVCERFGKNGQTYSLKCGRCNKTVQAKWNYCPFCGAKLREVEE